MQGLAGKRVIVTGGGEGIGKAIVDRFLAEGSRVLVIDKDERLLGKSADNYSELRLDITDMARVSHIIPGIPCDILINNAAITIGDDHDSITLLNYTATRHITEEVLIGMRARRLGTIVFITSVHTAIAIKGNAAYRGSKLALIGYMGGRAVEEASNGIRLNAVSPGAVQYAGTNHDKKMIIRNSKYIPMGRHALTSEIASSVAFIASDDASYITGHELRVDGALSIQSPFPD